MTDQERAATVVEWCRTLATCSETPAATTRTFLSPPMREVHARLGAWMHQLGMMVSVDAAGNLRGLYPGAPAMAAAPRLLIGSHLDTVPNAGAFDGVLGVVLALALIEGREAVPLPFAIEVVGFSEEEGVRFGVPFIGSRALAGTLDAAVLDRADAAGVRVREAIAGYGLDPSLLPAARVSGETLGYLEFHIEQGPLLEHLDLPVAVVDRIVGQRRFAVVFAGAANHAGTTPMRLRRDAVAGAAEWIVAVERIALAAGELVATVGRIDAEPGAGNVIAGMCRLTLDVRAVDDGRRDQAASQMLTEARGIGQRRGLAVTWDCLLDQPAVAMDSALTARLGRAALAAGAPVHHMSSGAGHDAMVIAARMPAAMLFLRSPGGVSHHPDETVRVEDVATALAIGRALLEDLADG
jgi:allantoate deiminase